MTRTGLWLAMMVGCCLWMACNDGPPTERGSPEHQTPGETSAPLTYWADMAPLFAEHCMRCHQDGGIAPFRLDDYAQAKSFSALIAHVTRERTMPPWSVTSDGSCGEFADSEALSDDEIERISKWAQSGAPEGSRRDITVPPVTTLPDAREFKTPDFAPEIQGGELAESDEYRCFELDAPAGPTSFITGYEVLPGNPQIVHHVVVMLVDPNASADLDDSKLTNAEQMRALDDESPDRDGWPCFGMAGDGLTVVAQPVVWAPGQGVVEFPNESGVPLRPEYKIIVQVHYNLADPKNRGTRDQTTVRLRTAPEVKNIGVFVLQDALLGTLHDDHPVTLPPGKSSTLFKWNASGKEIGLDSIPEAQLYGVMPHMHQLGHKYELTVSAGHDAPERCAANVENWDFHWQRMYFYAEPLTIKPDTQLSVTCDYDTSSVQAPVKPGWGTRNEMCLATLYFTVPASVYDKM
jgi:mono/diheme cytochrome c family protein